MKTFVNKLIFPSKVHAQDELEFHPMFLQVTAYVKLVREPSADRRAFLKRHPLSLFHSQAI